MARLHRIRLLIYTQVLVAPLALGACNTMAPPEAVLEGDWELLKASDTSGNRFLITLNAAGNVTETATVSGNVTVTNQNATGTVNLNGFDVTLRTGSVKFEGTFNDNFTIATGRQFTESDVPFVGLVTIDEGDATFMRID